MITRIENSIGLMIMGKLFITLSFTLICMFMYYIMFENNVLENC